MRIGAMNHPGKDLLREIEWMGSVGLDFIDLTLEPPAACHRSVNVKSISSALTKHHLGIVGHTAYYLPICMPFEGVRKAAVEELKGCLRVFGELGAQWMNLHPDRHAPFHSRAQIIAANLRSIEELLPVARECGVGLMIENLPGDYNTVGQLRELLEPVQELGLHLDIGHSNLMIHPNSADEILPAYGSRLKHVHLHDNKGGSADLHLPLGTGNINVPHHIRLLKASGYDGTITLEVFSEDPHYFQYSRDLLRRLWDAAAT